MNLIFHVSVSSSSGHPHQLPTKYDHFIILFGINFRVLAQILEISMHPGMGGPILNCSCQGYRLWCFGAGYITETR